MMLVILEIIFILTSGNQTPNGFGFLMTNPLGPKINKWYHRLLFIFQVSLYKEKKNKIKMMKILGKYQGMI